MSVTELVFHFDKSPLNLLFIDTSPSNMCDMSVTREVSQFDISPLNPDTSPEEWSKPKRLFILTIEPVFQVDMSPLKDVVPLNTVVGANDKRNEIKEHIKSKGEKLTLDLWFQSLVFGSQKKKRFEQSKCQIFY